MMPGFNQRQMRQAMKRMGIQQSEINAIQVIIKTPDYDLVFDSPEVTKVNMMGQETYQIIGEPEKVAPSATPQISDDDVQTVVSQTGVSSAKAKEALEKNNGDIAKTILELSEE